MGPSHELQLFRVNLLQNGVFRGLQCECLLHCAFSWGCRRMSALVPGPPPPLLPFLILVLVGLFLSCFSHSSLSQLLHSGFCPFFVCKLYQRYHHLGCRAQQCPVWQELAGDNRVWLGQPWPLLIEVALNPPVTSISPHIPQMLIQTERRENKSEPVYSCGL